VEGWCRIPSLFLSHVYHNFFHIIRVSGSGSISLLIVTTLETIYSKYFESIALLLLSSFIHLILLPLAVKIYLKVGPIEVKTLLHLLSSSTFPTKYT